MKTRQYTRQKPTKSTASPRQQYACLNAMCNTNSGGGGSGNGANGGGGSRERKNGSGGSGGSSSGGFRVAFAANPMGAGAAAAVPSQTSGDSSRGMALGGDGGSRGKPARTSPRARVEASGGGGGGRAIRANGPTTRAMTAAAAIAPSPVSPVSQSWQQQLAPSQVRVERPLLRTPAAVHPLSASAPALSASQSSSSSSAPSPDPAGGASTPASPAPASASPASSGTASLTIATATAIATATVAAPQRDGKSPTYSSTASPVSNAPLQLTLSLPTGAATCSTSAIVSSNVAGSMSSNCWVDADGCRWRSHFPPFVDDEVRRISDMFMRTINAHTYGYTQIESVSRIDTLTNPTLEASYKQMKSTIVQSGAEANEVVAFHGTPKETNIDGISKSNFDCKKLGQTTGNQGWYGSGVYLTQHAGAALRYQFWGTNTPPTRMLVCRALLGRVFTVPENSCEFIGKGLSNGCHSHRGRDRWDADWQLVVFNAAQILPIAHVFYR